MHIGAKSDGEACHSLLMTFFEQRQKYKGSLGANICLAFGVSLKPNVHKFEHCIEASTEVFADPLKSRSFSSSSLSLADSQKLV